MLALLAACAAPDAELARAAWMREVLARENEIWLTRDPALLAGKYERMADDRYDFLRGTAGFWYADVARPDPERPETRFVREPDAAGVLLVGDPHPENVGTCLPGEEPRAGDLDPEAALTLELVDLDGAVFGPWLIDVRRAALGIAALAPDACDEECRAGAADTLARAYAEALAEPVSPAEAEDAGALVAGLLADARADGVERERLQDVTVVRDNVRALVLDEALDEDGEGLLALTADEDAQLARLLDAWTMNRPSPFRVLGAGRRYGSGIASFPAVRYLVLWDRGEYGPADDYLLEVREVVDPPTAPGRASPVPALFDDNAHRIEQAAWLLWSRPDADARMAGVADGGQTFKVMNAGSWFREIHHEDVEGALVSGEAGAEDVAGFARTVGRVVAGAHARGVTADGEDAGAVVRSDLAGDVDGLAAEIVSYAEGDLDRLLRDHVLFAAVLEASGPVLGADALPDDL
jgi:uncharacterized protein (DUF2252 family)